MDANEKAAAKLNKEIEEVQAKQKKEFDTPRKNIPLNDDMGPLPKNPKKGLEEGLKLGGAKSLGMKKGGSASVRADGCCKKGKTKGRMV